MTSRAGLFTIFSFTQRKAITLNKTSSTATEHKSSITIISYYTHRLNSHVKLIFFVRKNYYEMVENFGSILNSKVLGVVYKIVPHSFSIAIQRVCLFLDPVLERLLKYDNKRRLS